MARGSIYPRELKDGTRVYDVRYRSSNGRQKHKRGFRGKRLAQAYLAEQLAMVNRGEVIVSTTPFEEYFDAWLAEHRPRVEPGTWREYEVQGRLRLKPYFGYQRLSQISSRDVRRFVAEQVAAGRVGTKTINNAIIVLSVCLSHAVEDGLIATNPAQTRRGARERIRLPEPHREMDYLRLEEIPVYLSACGRMYRPLAELLIATGLRISEALALQWDDVDLDGGRIRVMRALKKEGVGSTKGDRARAVDIGPRLDAVLRDLQAYQACFLPVGGSTPVFVRRDGTVPDRNSVSSGVHKATLRRAGLRETIRLHDLRHTAAATWLSAGLPLIYVQRQLATRPCRRPRRCTRTWRAGCSMAPRRRPSGRSGTRRGRVRPELGLGMGVCRPRSGRPVRLVRGGWDLAIRSAPDRQGPGRQIPHHCARFGGSVRARLSNPWMDTR